MLRHQYGQRFYKLCVSSVFYFAKNETELGILSHMADLLAEPLSNPVGFAIDFVAQGLLGAAAQALARSETECESAPKSDPRVRCVKPMTLQVNSQYRRGHHRRRS